jgi:hypothetical protein
MPLAKTFWLLQFPLVLGLLTVAGVAVLYIRWDICRVSGVLRRNRSLPSLKLKALAPLFLTTLLFSLLHIGWSMTLPWFSAVLVQEPYHNQASSIFGRCTAHIFAAVVTYLFSDAICRRLLRSPFQRGDEPIGALEAEQNRYVQLSQCLPSDQSHD